MNRLRVLAIAYACDPSKGSEYGVGWGWVNAIAADHNITVITADFNAPNIQRYFAEHAESNSGNPRFVYVRNRPWHYRPFGAWLKVEESFAKPLMNLAYQDWLRCTFEAARQELTRNHYDLVHLITFVGWRFPGKFYQLGIPFVWGPIGGMKNTPWRLLPILGAKGAIYYAGRNLVNSLQLKLLGGPRRAVRFANVGVIAATSEIQEELRIRYRTKSHVICEVGPPDIPVLSPNRHENEPFRICWSGQHLPGKALQLLLLAAARLPSRFDYAIEILGTGPCTEAWRSMAVRLQIAERCHWHGWVDRNKSLQVMRDSHVFVITSLKDLTSTVAVEAITLGLPIITLDHCGFADLVTAECGIKIPPHNSEQIISDLTVALQRLSDDEPLRFSLAQGAIERSQEFSWLRKMEKINTVYRLAIDPLRHSAQAPQGTHASGLETSW